MPAVSFHVRVDDVESCEILCSEANLAIDRADLGICVHTNVALVMGLPAAITKRELEIFVDPFAEGIEGLCLLKERKCFNTGPRVVHQYKAMALVFFVDESQLLSFKELYNNMQLPSYSETAPCVVVQLSTLVVHCSNAAALNNSASNSVSARQSPTMKQNAINASPGRPFTSKGSTPQQRQNDSLLNHGTELLMRHCVSPPSQLPASVSKVLPTESTEAQMVALPTCTVCLRRIRCVSTLARGLSGANDLMVGRSYTCDAKLTFDELNTIGNQKEEEVVAKVSGAKATAEGSEDSTGGVRCIVCHIYHEVTASRSIGNPNNTGHALLHRLQSLRFMDPAPNSAATTAAALDAPATTSSSDAKAPSAAVNASSVSSSGAALTSVGRCRMCHLSENIWLCLQCGHTGCGRYTSQHAKAHYQDTLQDTCQQGVFSASHNLSLELASGRIWNYETDTFDYIEDESASYFSNSGPTRAMARSTFHSVSGDTSTKDTATMQMDELPLDLDRASPTQCKKFLLPSFLYGKAGGGRQHHSEDLLDPSSSAALGLNDVTTDKINALMSNYERLLEAQLLDQQLYFEKLLARDTVRALELSYMPPPPSIDKSSVVNTTTKNKALTKKASFGESSTSAATEEKNDDLSPPVTTEDAAFIAAGTTLLTDSHAYREATSAVQNPEVVQYMNEVEQLKVEISTIEMQYREVLEKVKKADEATRGLKKTNDALLKGQQALKDKEIQLKARSAEVQIEHEAQVRDLNQQIQDLKFYVRARKEVQESPLKDELKTGTVVTSQRNPPPLTNSANSGPTSGGSGGDKKVAKRK